MSAELIGILSVGVALLGLGLRMSARLDDLDRLARVEGLQEGRGCRASFRARLPPATRPPQSAKRDVP